MDEAQVISEPELQAWLKDHAGWSVIEGELTAEFRFKNFSEAFGFICRVAVLMEKHNHHPTIVNSYNKVNLSMNTHDAGNKITDRDLKLAQAIESIE